MTHGAVRPVRVDYPSSLGVFGTAVPSDLGARQVAMNQQSLELTEYLKGQQKQHGWQLENGFYIEGGTFEHRYLAPTLKGGE